MMLTIKYHGIKFEVIDYLSETEYIQTRPGVRRVRAGNSIKYQYYCMDCSILDPPLFIVHDDLWFSIFPDKSSGMICWNCFEIRLGRKLTLSDLKRVPINSSYFIGFELGVSSERLSCI